MGGSERLGQATEAGGGRVMPGIGKAFVSAFITLILASFTLADPELPEAISYVLLGLAFMNLVGSLMMLTPLNRAGAIMVIIFSIPFVPIGIIGILGARNWLDHLKREAFKAAVS